MKIRDFISFVYSLFYHLGETAFRMFTYIMVVITFTYVMTKDGGVVPNIIVNLINIGFFWCFMPILDYFILLLTTKEDKDE